MPIRIDKKLPAVEILRTENIFVMDDQRAAHQDIRPLKILILNLMPQKMVTEAQLLRHLANTPLQLDIDFLYMESHQSKTTRSEHMETFYKTFSEIKDEYFDGLIITGAPVEHLPFEEVDYWEEFTQVIDWSNTHVYSTLHICWGAQAALYYRYGVDKHQMAQKLSGIYPQDVLKEGHFLLRGFDDLYVSPHSRHTEILKEDILNKTNLEILANFWINVAEQDDSVFSDKVLKKLSILNYAPNGMWAYLTSVYFMQNKDDIGNLDNDAFNEFLDKIIAFIWTYAIMRPGVNALRTPVYPEMINVVNNKQVTFDDYKFDEDSVRTALESYQFTNGRPITKSMLAWWMYTNDKQDLLLLDTKLEIEHIYSRKRQENENGLADKWSLESLGNKALLEKAINIRASDYRFIDKLKYYKGFVTDKGKVREGTKNMELIELLTNSNDFMEADIIARKDLIISKFIDYLQENDLLL